MSVHASPSSSSSSANWLVGLLLLACGLAAYVVGALRYLAGLPHAWPLALAFASSLGFALMYDVRRTDLHGSLVRTLATTGLFLCAMWLAPSVRQVFVAFAEAARSGPEVAQLFGPDFASMLANRTVGYWGGLGVCLALGRLFCYDRLKAVMGRVVGTPPGTRCPHCDHALVSASAPPAP